MKKNTIVLIIFLSLNILIASFSFASSDVNLIVDGKDITDLANPVIKNGRTLIPVRFVSEELGAEVIWNNEEKTVLIKKNNKSIFLKIDSRIVNYNNNDFYQISDVAPIIINDRTYVPVRLISNGLGAYIDWDNNTRTVVVDSSKNSEIESFYEMSFNETNELTNINGKKDILVNVPEEYQNENYNLKLFLLDIGSFSGYLVAKENANENILEYNPKVEDNGEKIFVAAIFDSNNNWVMGTIKKTFINIIPEVSGVVDSEYAITPKINFLAKYVSYEIKNLNTNKVIKIEKRDPYDKYKFTPDGLGTIDYAITIKASDFNGNIYLSDEIMFQTHLANELSLVGITNNMIITKSDTLLAKRNFDVMETTYYIMDEETGVEKILATIPYGSYEWSPTKEDEGNKLLKVSVVDTNGVRYDSDYIKVKIDFSPYLKIKGIGPKQVITKETTISSESNVELDNLYFILENNDTGNKRTLLSDIIDGSFMYIPNEKDQGNISIIAYGSYKGETISSDMVDFKVYFGETYGPKAIIEKDKFLDFVSEMAVNSYNKTDMSAALQTAQAILETGWGQSVPVDKYSEKFSNNLFGIKGAGSDGSVISNTWEVYNGVVYRVDAYFRAYNNPEESWKDHKKLLLEKSRYQIFRDVMYDDTLGAWAIRRAGYATDPKYPIKLMDIIERYNLKELDKVDL